MSLNDRQHVEAVAIVRTMHDAGAAAVDPDAGRAAEQWLAENHPAPSVYMAALAEAGCDDGTTYRHYVNDEGTVMVWLWDDGTVEVARRPSPAGSWGPPTVCHDKGRG